MGLTMKNVKIEINEILYLEYYNIISDGKRNINY